MGKRFSVIIPTLWEPSFFLNTLEELNEFPLVDEIIIISNDPNRLPNNTLPSKVKVYEQSSNIGVNPAWNLGATLAKNEHLVFLNDDLIIGADFFETVNTLTEDFQMIGIDYDNQKKSLKEIKKRNHGFGCCFYLHKSFYKPIPEGLKVFFGDDWLFFHCIKLQGKIAVVSGISTNGILSLSSKKYSSGVLIEFQTYMKEISLHYKHDYKFSIIIPYHHSVLSAKEVKKLLKSLSYQTFKDFEVILIHDGPNPDASELNFYENPLSNFVYKETEERFDDWGHSLRDLGISYAKGEYLMFLNCDNVFYNNGLSLVNECLENPEPYGYTYGSYKWDSKDIVIFPIKLIGQTTDGFHLFRNEDDPKTEIILTGYPPEKNHIDCMQLVMSRAKWLYYGGWYDKSFAADGEMYPRFVRENLGARYVSKVLGEHR